MRARELRMLFYKSWLETRWGFLLALSILLAFSLWSVLRFPEALRSGVRGKVDKSICAKKWRGVLA